VLPLAPLLLATQPSLHRLPMRPQKTTATLGFPLQPLLKKIFETLQALTVRGSQQLKWKPNHYLNIARIAKCCPENISLVVKLSKCFYLRILLKFFSINPALRLGQFIVLKCLCVVCLCVCLFVPPPYIFSWWMSIYHGTPNIFTDSGPLIK
jgi:hypothetical protein